MPSLLHFLTENLRSGLRFHAGLNIVQNGKKYVSFGNTFEFRCFFIDCSCLVIVCTMFSLSKYFTSLLQLHFDIIFCNKQNKR